MVTEEKYIGSPCGVVLCIDSCVPQIRGRLYHGYAQQMLPFQGIEKALFLMDDLFDSMQFPFPGTENRSFLSKKKKIQKRRMRKVMSDEELLRKHGDKGTFIIRVKSRQHSSWQGLVTWTEEQKTLPFRSVLELIKIIDEALSREDLEQRSSIDSREWENGTG